jgi:hypothetical protein
MDTDIGTDQIILTLSSLANNATNDYYFTRFVSHRIKQSGIGANTWFYNFATKGNNANTNFAVNGTNVGVPINV